MTSQSDLFGGTSKVAEHKLNTPVSVRVNVITQSADAVLVEGGTAALQVWLPKKLCNWTGELGMQDMPVEKFKADENRWLQ